MKAFIFDFDGVIVDSELHWDRHSFRTIKAVIPAFTKEYDRTLKGRNIHDVYTMLKRDFGLQMEKDAYMAHIDTLTDEIYNTWTNLIPGVKDLLERLHARGVRTAIASSGERRWIEPTLGRLGMKDAFGPIVTARDVGIGKPDPAVYLEAARQTGCEPADCIALEDATIGVASAKAAGMTCIALRHGPEYYQQDLSQADVVVRGMDEITEQLLAGLGM